MVLLNLRRHLEEREFRFDFEEFVRSIVKSLLFVLSSILLNLVSNYLAMKEANHISLRWLYLRYIPSAFIQYLLLTLTTLIVGLVGLVALAFVAEKNVITFKKAVLPWVGTSPLQSPQVASTAQSQRTIAPPPNSAGNLDASAPSTPCAEWQSTGAPQPSSAGNRDAPAIATGSAGFQGRGTPDPQGTGAPQPNSAGNTTDSAGFQGIGTPDPQGTGAPPRNTRLADPGVQDNSLGDLIRFLKEHPDTKSASWATENSGDVLLVFRYVDNKVTEVADAFQPVTSLRGSRILHKRIEIGSQTKDSELEEVRNQLVESMRRAREVDRDCTLQFGSFAVVKYTESGHLKWWRLQTHWTPVISNFTRRISLLNLLRGSHNKWMISGFNLQSATLKASTTDKKENILVLERRKIETGEDLLICEEPRLVQRVAAMFWEKVYICASKFVEVEKGVIIDLHSKPVDTQYLIPGIKSFIPNLWTMIIISSLALLERFIQKLLEENPILRGLWHLFIVCTFITFTTICSFPKLMSTLRLPGLGVDDNVKVGTASLSTPEGTSIENKQMEVAVNEGKIEGVDDNVKVVTASLSTPKGKSIENKQMKVDVIKRKIKAAVSTSDEPRYPRPPPGCTDKAQLNDSVWELYSPGEEEHLVDVIFFHGLQRTDNYEDAFWKTWLAKDEEQLVWPRDWLAKEFPYARILFVSYDSIAKRMERESSYDMERIGDMLIQDIVLDSDPDIFEESPMILVGHCLGGLVIKQLLSSLMGERGVFQPPDKEHRIHRFLSRVKGLYLYGTPGDEGIPSDLTRRLTSPSPILKFLKEINHRSRIINADFRSFKSFRKFWHIETHGMLEDLPTKCAGFYGVVVPEASARFDLDSFDTQREADHFTVCQAKSMRDHMVKRLVEFICINLQT